MTIPITERIYALELPAGPIPWHSWAYLIVHPTSRRLLLIDSGGPGSGKILPLMVNQAGYRLDDLAGIALTHWHADHTGGIAELVDAMDHDITLYGSAADLDIYRQQKPTFLQARPVLFAPRGFRLRLKLPRTPARRNLAFVSLDHEDTLAEWGLRTMPTPGHTSGHTAYYALADRALLCGDAVFLSGDRAYTLPFYTDLAQLQETAQRLLFEETFDWLLPGHQEPARMLARPRHPEGKKKSLRVRLGERMLGLQYQAQIAAERAHG